MTNGQPVEKQVSERRTDGALMQEGGMFAAIGAATGALGGLFLFLGYSSERIGWLTTNEGVLVALAVILFVAASLLNAWTLAFASRRPAERRRRLIGLAYTLLFGGVVVAVIAAVRSHP